MDIYDLRPIFEWIVAYKVAHDGNSPTLREIKDECHISSISVAHYILRRMEKVGWIKRIGSARSRSIAVIGGRWSMVTMPVERPGR